jgi:RHS repeat-associated protein
VITASDRKGQAVSTTCDPLNRPLTASYADGSTVTLTWDLGGRLMQVQDSVGGTISRSYDDLDRLLSETTPQGAVNYTYDAAGRRLTMQAGSQAQVTYSYDDANRLTGITQGSNSIAFGYDAANRRTSATLPGGITATYGWDAASQLTSITYANGSTTFGTLTYGYDMAGRITSRGGTLFQSVLPSAVTSATYDLANRLTSRTAAGVTASPTWDTNGNLTSDGVRTYTWDARNRLSGISGVASFSYDGSNRRQTATRGGTPTSFLYDGWDVAQEQQGGTPSADLMLGLGADEHFTRSGSTMLTDALGSTVALVSASTILTSYGYDPYGVTQITGAASDNTFQFTGRENDNTGLMNYRNRYYNPAWGRFISEDPIGLNGGDINLYRYVGNSPAQLRDPSGNEAISIGVGIGLGLAIGASYLYCRAIGGCTVPPFSLPCWFGGACPAPPPATPATKPKAQGNPGNPCIAGNNNCSSSSGGGSDGSSGGGSGGSSGGSGGTGPEETFTNPADAIGDVHGIADKVGEAATKNDYWNAHGYTQTHYYLNSNGEQLTVFYNPSTGIFAGGHFSTP